MGNGGWRVVINVSRDKMAHSMILSLSLCGIVFRIQMKTRVRQVQIPAQLGTLLDNLRPDTLLGPPATSQDS